MSVELRNRLQASLGKPLPATLVFDFPSVTALVDHFMSDWKPTTEIRSSTAGKKPDRHNAAAVADVDLATVQKLTHTEAEDLLAAELSKAREMLL
jgi:hypothetical protein